MSGNETPTPAKIGTLRDGRVLAFGTVLFVAFLVSVVMLVTDKNLQTDFGAVSPYYLHWYGVLAMAIVDLVVAAALFGTSRSAMRDRMSASTRRAGVIAAVAWVVIAIVVMVGIVATYSQVGFANMGQFEQYLFGVTPYSGALSYIPWLYDLLLAVYIVALGVGAFATQRAAPTVPGAA
jgi:hypothetical protein